MLVPTSAAQYRLPQAYAHAFTVKHTKPHTSGDQFLNAYTQIVELLCVTFHSPTYYRFMRLDPGAAEVLAQMIRGLHLYGPTPTGTMELDVCASSAFLSSGATDSNTRVRQRQIVRKINKTCFALTQLSATIPFPLVASTLHPLFQAPHHMWLHIHNYFIRLLPYAETDKSDHPNYVHADQVKDFTTHLRKIGERVRLGQAGDAKRLETYFKNLNLQIYEANGFQRPPWWTCEVNNGRDGASRCTVQSDGKIKLEGCGKSVHTLLFPFIRCVAQVAATRLQVPRRRLLLQRSVGPRLAPPSYARSQSLQSISCSTGRLTKLTAVRGPLLGAIQLRLRPDDGSGGMEVASIHATQKRNRTSL